MKLSRNQRSRILGKVQARLGELDPLGFHAMGSANEYDDLASHLVSQFLRGSEGDDLVTAAKAFIAHYYEVQPSLPQLEALKEDLSVGGALRIHMEALKSGQESQ
jgi:hypothetical protein